MASTAKTLTFVIPAYNMESYLDRCVNSLLSASDISDLEVLIVDDGSKDGTLEYARKLERTNPGAVRAIHQENKGQGGARNTGLEAAAGTYLFSWTATTPSSGGLSAFKTAIARTHAEVLAFNFFSDDGAGHLTPMSANYAQYNGSFTIGSDRNFSFPCLRPGVGSGAGTCFCAPAFVSQAGSGMKICGHRSSFL